MNYAYVTMLSSKDYLPAVCILNASLRRVNSKFPLVAMVVDSIWSKEVQKVLSANNIMWELVPPLSYSKEIQEKFSGKRVLNTASKVQLFTLKDYDKLVYLDADTLVVQNIDDLFSRPDGSMVKYSGDAHGFTGMFVFCPRNHYEDEFYETIMTNHLCFDGDLIGKLWFFIADSEAHRIPPNYFWNYNPYKMDYNVKVVHFIFSEKPWLNPSHELYQITNPYIDFYFQLYKEIEVVNDEVLQRNPEGTL